MRDTYTVTYPIPLALPHPLAPSHSIRVWNGDKFLFYLCQIIRASALSFVRNHHCSLPLTSGHPIFAPGLGVSSHKFSASNASFGFPAHSTISLGSSIAPPSTWVPTNFIVLSCLCFFFFFFSGFFSFHLALHPAICALQALLDLLQGLQRESKDCEKYHYKNKTRKPNNTKMPSLVSVTISLKQIRRLPGARRSHFDVCFPGYNGGQAVPQHLNTAPAN